MPQYAIPAGLQPGQCWNRQNQRLARLVREYVSQVLTTPQGELLELHVAIHFARLLPYKALQNVRMLPVYYAQMLRSLNRFCQQRYGASQ